MKKKAIWFSRHQPTAAQLTEISVLGYEITDMEESMKIAAKSINTAEELDDIVTYLGLLSETHSAIFGVIPVPIRGELYRVCIPVYESWNIQRSVEGQKPTFEHKQFVKTF